MRTDDDHMSESGGHLGEIRHTCTTTEPNCGVTPCVGAVAEAMQAVWDDFVGDTGCFPDFITVEHGRNVRLRADFGVGNFALLVAMHLSDIGRQETDRG